MAYTICRLIYFSENSLSGTPGEQAAELGSILATARINNERLNITGALLFNRGCFIQALEGPQEAVEHLFEQIAIDRRHCNVTPLEVTLCEQRLFPRWSMHYEGAIEDDRISFAALSLDPAATTGTVLEVMKAVVLRREQDAHLSDHRRSVARNWVGGEG